MKKNYIFVFAALLLLSSCNKGDSDVIIQEDLAQSSMTRNGNDDDDPSDPPNHDEPDTGDKPGDEETILDPPDGGGSITFRLFHEEIYQGEIFEFDIQNTSSGKTINSWEMYLADTTQSYDGFGIIEQSPTYGKLYDSGYGNRILKVNYRENNQLESILFPFTITSRTIRYSGSATASVGLSSSMEVLHTPGSYSFRWNVRGATEVRENGNVVTFKRTSAGNVYVDCVVTSIPDGFVKELSTGVAFHPRDLEPDPDDPAFIEF